MEIAFSADWNGERIDFHKVDDGFAYLCPKKCCRAYHWFETKSGQRHRITSAEGAPVSIVASLLCPCPGCGFHVVITDGIAKG